MPALHGKVCGAPSWHDDLLCQVFGPESSGKTTLAMHAIAEIQRQGGTAALIDAEHAFDPVYSGVSRLFVLAPQDKATVVPGVIMRTRRKMDQASYGLL